MPAGMDRSTALHVPGKLAWSHFQRSSTKIANSASGSGSSSEVPTLDGVTNVGWHRKVLRKVFRRPPLRMQVELSAEQTTGVFGDADFIKTDLEIMSPADLFPVDPALLGSEIIDVPWGQHMSLQVEVPSTTKSKKTGKKNIKSKASDALAKPPLTEARGSPATRVTRMWYQNIVADLLDRWSKGNHVNLNVNVEPSPLSLLRGHLRCDATANFDRIVFGAIRMSGGRIQAQGLAVNLWSFTSSTPQRYPFQFDFVAQNITFTQEDLFESNCIRNGLSRLLARVVKQTGVTSSTVRINSIEILPSNKMSIQGEATTLFGSSVPFQVRSGLATTGRGHVLNFPGLEISISSSAEAFFVPVLPPITLDLGHNAQLTKVTVDGVAQQLRVCARVTIIPTHTRKLPDYMQSKNSYAASHSVDVGRWLTKLGNFSYN